jgi:D-3-phosphoglycerate dehydrogenase / 2-oxoglutarate reductase
MYNVRKLNSISNKGLALLDDRIYNVSSDEDSPDAIIVRSFNLHDMDFTDNLKAIVRAGAGVNNIPVERCTGQGIAVFNTPGANANAVKELAIASLFISSRNLLSATNWVQSLKGNTAELSKLVEKQKSSFSGPEIMGKTLGVIGLGAIGVMVANNALALGMEVTGFDPFISINAAWELDRQVLKAASLEHLISVSDYITLHVPLNKETTGMINRDMFSIMKKGTRLINFARGELVVNTDLFYAIDQAIVSCYVTDFPSDELLGNEKIIAIPHLGASTPESEENCAVMAANQLRDYIENGNIKNSVNFPDCELRINGNNRITAIHENIPNMLGQVTTLLAQSGINISDMLSRNKNNIAYTILDIEGSVTGDIISRISGIKGMKRIRIL